MIRNIFFVLSLIFGFQTVGLAGNIDSARSELTTGTRFYVGFIHPDRAAGEPLTDSSYRIVIHARQESVIRIGTRTFVAQPSVPLVIKLPVTDVVEVNSNRPISVYSYQDLAGNGEQAWHLPCSSWGRSYRPFAWWTDRNGLDSSTMRYSSAKRLIIARDDETRVSVETLSGRRDSLLNAGDHWLVSEEIDTSTVRQYVSDPTGLVVSADKPIGVVSGHAKAAVPAYPDGLPKTGPYARSANRCRGNLHDAMLPETMGGTEFVTLPLAYTPTRARGLDLSNQGISNDQGDVIRMIALKDSTRIMHVLSDGSVETDTVIQKGHVFTNDRVETGTLWKTSKPVLAAQYGKSYGRITSQASLPEDDPTTDAGMPLLMVIPPVERWVTHASVHTQPEMYNVVSIAARTTDVPRIRVNGRGATSMARMVSIPGTEFSTLTFSFPEGLFEVASDSGKRFACWTYGSLDGFQLGKIYGSVAALDVHLECSDTVALTYAADGATGQIAVQSSISWQADSCSELAMLYVKSGLRDSLWYRDGTKLIVRSSARESPIECTVVAVSTSGRSDTLLIREGAVNVGEETSQTLRPMVNPNPADDVAMITRLDTFIGSTLEIFLPDGRRVWSGHVTGDRMDIPTASFCPGFYMIRIAECSMPLIVR
ncbi:MAG: hypothetical protein FGM33_01920 [Candidatus Kapabacteria bacterium]|nr:hypothetical protein [Candidatus Kapabacteria bacterium]